MRNTILAAAVLWLFPALCLAAQPVTPTGATGNQQIIDASGNAHVTGGGNSGTTLTLLTNASSSGSPVTASVGGGYYFNLSGTFGGTTVALTQTINSVTTTVASYTAASSTGSSTPCYQIGAGTVVTATVTGGSPSGLNATLNGANTCPSPGASTGATSTLAGGTVTTHNVFQQALAANAARKGCLIQNQSTDVEYVFFGATGSATETTSFALGPASVTGSAGGSVSCNFPGVVLTDNIAITSKTADGSATYVVSAQ